MFLHKAIYDYMTLHIWHCHFCYCKYRLCVLLSHVFVKICNQFFYWHVIVSIFVNFICVCLNHSTDSERILKIGSTFAEVVKKSSAVFLDTVTAD